MTRPTYQHKGAERCPKCDGQLTVVVGPFSYNFGRVGCLSCKTFVKWAGWPQERELLLLAADAPCKSCGAPINFVGTGQGKRIPVDIRPIQGVTGKGAIVAVRTSHFATCPDAAAHRTAKARGRGKGGADG